ncbi:MAG: hypothetical protein K2I23_01070 [Clostridia bacterium]|nr:hypothetical protein [Clostridia bacterium]
MDYSKEEYEKAINNSPLFEIEIDNNIDLYKRERYNLLCLITDYYRLYVYKSKKLEDYSLTLMETATECIKYYKKDKGDFINLLNYSMKRNFGIAKAKEAVDNYRQGITLSGENDELIRSIIAYAKSKHLNLSNISSKQKIADVMKISLEKVEELIAMNENATVMSPTIRNEDGDEVEIFDLQQNQEDTVENKIIADDTIKEWLDSIEMAFDVTQDRQKKILSMLITAKLLNEFRTMDMLIGRSFYNKELAEFYGKCRQAPTAKQIAELCGVSEQSASRTFANFIKKIKR